MINNVLAFLVLCLALLNIAYSSRVPVDGWNERYLREVAEVLFAYKQDCGKYPEVEEFPLALISSDKKCWGGPYIKNRKLVDYWGRDVVYELVEREGVMQLNLRSIGEDGKYGTSDDIVYGNRLKPWEKEYEPGWWEDDRYGLYVRVYVALGVLVLMVFALFRALRTKK